MGASILIVDKLKASVVMSSEIIKNKINNVSLKIVDSGQKCLNMIQNKNFDMCIVDFDLPDVDGVTLILEIRKIYKGPILLTAFSDQTVKKAVNNDLFAFNDSYDWIDKPIKSNEFAKKLDKFLIKKSRIEKRFPINISTKLYTNQKNTDTAVIKNLSISGLCLELKNGCKFKTNDEILLSLALPYDDLKENYSKIKANICWCNDRQNIAGIQFLSLTKIQQKAIKKALKDCQI